MARRQECPASGTSALEANHVHGIPRALQAITRWDGLDRSLGHTLAQVDDVCLQRFVRVLGLAVSPQSRLEVADRHRCAHIDCEVGQDRTFEVGCNGDVFSLDPEAERAEQVDLHPSTAVGDVAGVLRRPTVLVGVAGVHQDESLERERRPGPHVDLITVGQRPADSAGWASSASRNDPFVDSWSTRAQLPDGWRIRTACRCDTPVSSRSRGKIDVRRDALALAVAADTDDDHR